MLKKVLSMLMLAVLVVIMSVPLAGAAKNEASSPKEIHLKEDDEKIDIWKEYVNENGLEEVSFSPDKAYTFSDGNTVVLFELKKSANNLSLYIVEFDSKNNIVDVVNKTLDKKAKQYVIENATSNETITQDYDGKIIKKPKEDCLCSPENNSSDQSQSLAGGCPDGYMWEEYNCREESYINWGIYATCMSRKLSHSTCVALATQLETVCDGECVPIA